MTVILARAPLATQAEVQAFESWVNSVPDAHIKEWKAQPGNYHLMTKQGEQGWGHAGCKTYSWVDQTWMM